MDGNIKNSKISSVLWNCEYLVFKKMVVSSWSYSLVMLTFTCRPVVGYINICPTALSIGKLEPIAKHEIFHALVSSISEYVRFV